MPRVGFEPTNPVLERAETVHALNRAATVIAAFSSATKVSVHINYYAEIDAYVHSCLHDLHAHFTCVLTCITDKI
jgi:hypothetical protein